ncbi:hypothetical protein [Streptomyces sp. H39-S7]|uniref:hypothetical protein n=1 Tax=Streptomyces sp. H39-S7 TaxID=3004357 RepID=UPI0022B0203E|nr:hypothetical protein [Streptomyces sp. H39-S7]MCZ4117806.1 hypothetical protein [Streptomyces sp. H39-S7]
MDAMMRPDQDGSPRDLSGEGLLARQRSILTWCDLHLMATATLTWLMVDDTRTVTAAMAEVLADPDKTQQPPRPDHVPSGLQISSGRCPRGITGMDRVELGLHLLAERTCAAAAVTHQLTESAVRVKLHSALKMLAAPCDPHHRQTLPPVVVPAPPARRNWPASGGVAWGV